MMQQPQLRQPEHLSLSPQPYKDYMYPYEFSESPRTITLRNQSESLLRSMTHDHTAMMLTGQRDRLFRQEAKPFLPAIGTTKSNPIRITGRKQLQPRYISRKPSTDPDDDAHLSASPTELQHFYDEATWRMYHLIQAARAEKLMQQQAAQSTAAAVAMDDPAYDAFFGALPNRAPASLLPYARPSLVAPEDDFATNHPENDDGVFELEDF